MNIYVVDSGLRLTHHDFAGRAESGIDFLEENEVKDCQGHGTSVGSLAAGRYSGIARDARLISVRVLDCDGIGHCSNVVKALKWIKRDARKRQPARAVVVMSLGSRNERCQPTIQLTRDLARDGILVVAASGNGKKDSCGVYPARSEATLTVSATDKYDRLYKKNNMGSCVDLLAPGVGVIAAWGNVSDSEYRFVSGTSHATPLVAGTAALILAADPSLSTRQLRDIIIGSATVGRIRDEAGTPLPRGQVNRLLFAPWATLFNEVLRDAKLARRIPELVGNRSAENMTSDSWNMVKLDLSSRVVPAMQYSALMVREAIVRMGVFDEKDVIMRRAYGVKRMRNGTEPSVIRLHVYVRNGKRTDAYVKNAIRSGQLRDSCKEKVRFIPDTPDNYVYQGMELPKGIDDKCKQLPHVHLDAPSIVLSTILAWIMLLVTTGVMTMAWKRKFWTVERRDTLSTTTDNSQSVCDVGEDKQ